MVLIKENRIGSDRIELFIEYLFWADEDLCARFK